MKRKCLAVGIILLFVGTCVIPFISSCRAESDTIYFEDVYVFITGRCRSIGSVDAEWTGGLFIGNQIHPNVHAYDAPLERLNIHIYKDFISGSCLSLKQSKNTSVHLLDANGIFFWGSTKQYSARLIKPVVFVLCHAEEVYIYRMNY
jgi:hypothetical protein